ncbi:MAG: S1 RNA-binding domain-containing protein, partial [Rhodospirillales bacterium]|nr:S1 RNA-binding domain-containing protein [Rhodospirillales bacterium]
TSQEVEVMVLDTDPEKRRISLGLKQCGSNPWEDFVENHTTGSEVEGEIKNITEFGLFIGLVGGIDGMAHLSDLSWEKSGEDALSEYKKGDMVKAKVLDVDIEKERISLGIKQLTEDPFQGEAATLKKGAVVTCTVTAITDGGIEVKVGEGLTGFIRKGDLSRERSEQRPDRFAKGDKIDAKIMQIDTTSRKLTLSVKTLEAAEEKKAMKEYGSSDSGASLGDILGAAIREKQDVAEPEEKKPAKKAAAKKAAPKKAAKADEADEAVEAVEATDEEAAPKKKAAAKKAAPKKAAPKKAAAKKSTKKDEEE